MKCISRTSYQTRNPEIDVDFTIFDTYFTLSATYFFGPGKDPGPIQPFSPLKKKKTLGSAGALPLVSILKENGGRRKVFYGKPSSRSHFAGVSTWM